MAKQHRLSIFKGKKWPLYEEGECLTADGIFEHTLKSNEKLKNNEKVSLIHGISLEPGSPVVYFEDKIIPVSQINSEANQLARAIMEKSPGSINADGDTIIMLEMPRCPDLVIAMLATWKLKAAFVIVDKSFPDQRVHHILEDCHPAFVITNEENNGRYLKNLFTVTYEELKKEASNLSPENLPLGTKWGADIPEFDRIMTVVYTSGSTGTPKGVRVRHRNILTRIKWEFKNFPYSETETVGLFKTSATFLDWTPELLCPLLTGRSLVILSNREVADVSAFVNLCEKHKIGRIMVVPTYLQSVLHYIESSSKQLKSDQAPIRRMPDLKLCFSTSETLHVSLARKFYKYFPEKDVKLFNFLGATEVTSDVLGHEVKGVSNMSDADKIPLGTVFDNMVVYILDEEYRPVLHGESGEVWVSGLNVSAGYVGNRDPHKFMDNPFSTDPGHSKIYRFGDYGRYVNGSVYHEGRIDSLIKIRGHRVELAEVEAAVGNISGVDKFCVLCYKAGQPDQVLLAFVTQKEPGLQASTLEEELEKVLVPYMMPSVMVVPEIPTLLSNKVDRQALFKQYEARIEKDAEAYKGFDYSGIPPEYHHKAKILFETVALSLGENLKAKLCGESNFFKIGGSSLNTVLTVSNLSDIGYAIAIEDFLNAKDMFEIMSIMREIKATDEFSALDLTKAKQETFQIEVVAPEHKDDLIRLITDAFTKKSDLEQYFSKEDICEEDYANMINLWWDTMLQDKISFIVKNSNGEIVGASVNVDFFCCPSHEEVIKGKASIMIDQLLTFLEGQFNESELFQRTKKILYSFMGASIPELSPTENVQLFVFLEEAIEKIARERGFKAIFSVNSSPLAQQLSVDIFGYNVLLDYQLNKFIASDGTRPFAAAPDYGRAVVAWKTV